MLSIKLKSFSTNTVSYPIGKKIHHDVPILNTYAEDLSKRLFPKKINKNYANKKIIRIIHEIHIRNVYTNNSIVNKDRQIIYNTSNQIYYGETDIVNKRSVISFSCIRSHHKYNTKYCHKKLQVTSNR